MTSHTYDSNFYYFTCDSDAGKIERGARFHRAASKPGMMSQMQERCYTEITEVEEGDFGDCWAKVINEPTEDDFERWSDEYGLPSDCFIVRAPGTHPGGAFYWVDLSIPVYVPVFKIEAEE